MPAGMYYNSAQLPKTVYMECLGPSTGSIELWYREAGQAFCDNHVFTIISVEVKNPVNPNRAVANDSDDFFFRGLSTEPDVDDVKVYYDFLPVGLTATSVKLLLKESETTLREITLTSEPGQNLLAEWDGKDATGSYYDKWDFHAVIEVTVAGIKFTSMEHPIADILFKHRPLVYIHQSEFSGPVDVDIMMDHADLREDVTGTDPTVATAPLDFSDLTGSHDTVNHYQDLDDSYRQSGAGTKTVFCRGTTQGGYVYLQYWHFEPSSSLPDVLTFYHEGDWEMFQIAAKLDTGNENLTPIAVTGGQHFYGQTIRWDSIGNGPTSQDQDYVEKSGHRPKIYVAREGHATYFRDGDFRSPISISTDNHGEQYLPAPTINHIDDETGSLSHNYTLSIFHDNMIPDWKGLWGARLVGPNRNGPPSPALGTTAVVNRWADPKLFNNYYRKLVSYPGGAPAHPETEIP